LSNKEHGFGALNPVKVSKTQSILKDTDFFTTIRQIAKKVYTPNSLDSLGPFKGIVLRRERSIGGQLSNPASWIFPVFFGSNKDIPELKGYKVRIPELHSWLPYPEELFDKITSNSSESDKEIQNLIDLYPTFYETKPGLSEAMPGDIVVVDFLNRKNLTDPVYIDVFANYDVGSGKYVQVNTANNEIALGDQTGQASPVTLESFNVQVKGTEANSSKKYKLIKVTFDMPRFGAATKNVGASVVGPYPDAKLREDTADAFFKIKDILNNLGCVLCSSGTSADSPGKGLDCPSLHLGGVAIDLYLGSGPYDWPHDPKKDEYVVVRDGPRKFYVYARSNKTVGTSYKGYIVEEKTLDAISVRKIVETKNPKELKIINVTGIFVDLTKIFSDFGFFRINGKDRFFVKGETKYSEWWHYEQRPIEKGQTYRDFLAQVHPESTINQVPEGILKKVWGGGMFSG